MLRRKPQTTEVITIVPEREYTMQDLQTALAMFVNAAGNIIGLDSTVQLVECLTSLIQEEPTLAKKLANPEIQKELLDMSKSLKGKQIGFMDIMPLISKVAKVLE